MKILIILIIIIVIFNTLSLKTKEKKKKISLKNLCLENLDACKNFKKMMKNPKIPKKKKEIARVASDSTYTLQQKCENFGQGGYRGKKNFKK
jgi:hypothetical protein